MTVIVDQLMSGPLGQLGEHWNIITKVEGLYPT